MSCEKGITTSAGRPSVSRNKRSFLFFRTSLSIRETIRFSTKNVTRKSCIELLKSWGVPVEERLLSVDELFEAAKNGTLEEAWCVGTAAVISPIGELAWNEETFEVNQNRIGALSQRLYDELTGIQWGTKPDPFGWTCVV